MTERGKILVVEDETAEREALARYLRVRQFDVLAAENADQAMQYIEEPIACVVSDMRLGPVSGMDLLRHWAERRPNVPFILTTDDAEIESAVEAIKLGAVDYLTKPVDPRRVLELIQAGLERDRLAREPPILAAPLARKDSRPAEILGASPAIHIVREQVRRAGSIDAPVMIRGESGTGKSLVAAAIHEHSPRRGGPLVVVHMAAIPDMLVESALFGSAGVLPEATEHRAGWIEQANGGTLFLDEIGDLSAQAQTRLLRFLENRTVTAVGGKDDVAVHVRLIVGTNRDLERMVAARLFRADLYYRLRVSMVTLPPLRDRRGDILLLADHFVREICQARQLPPRTVAAELWQYLQAHHWPGNVRQLRNCLESMIVMTSRTTLRIDDLPPNFLDPDLAVRTGVPFLDLRKGTLDEVERAAILRTLRQFGGDRTEAAKALGISLRTLYRRLREWQWQCEGPEALGDANP